MINNVTAYIANGRIQLVAYPDTLYKLFLEIRDQGLLVTFRGEEINDLMAFLTMLKADRK